MAVGDRQTTTPSPDLEEYHDGCCVRCPTCFTDRFSLADAATSRYIPTPFILAWRLSVLVVLIIALCYISIESRPSRLGIGLLVLYSWNVPVVFSSFLLVVCTVLHVTLLEARHHGLRHLSYASVALWQMFAMGSIGLNVFVLVTLSEQSVEDEVPIFTAAVLFNIIVVLLDFLLTLRMQLCFESTFFAGFMGIVLLILTWKGYIPLVYWFSGAHVLGIAGLSILYSLVNLLPREPS